MRGRAAVLFNTGAVIAGALTYWTVGLLGLMPGHSLFLILALVLLLYSAYWHAAGRSNVPMGRERFQARRDWVRRGRRGLVYFGAVLGVGLLTEMSTPLVYAGAALSAGTGGFRGLAYGIGFGLGRAMPAWAGAVVGQRFPPGKVGLAFIENYRRLRWVGVLASLTGVMLIGGSLARAIAVVRVLR